MDKRIKIFEGMLRSLSAYKVPEHLIEANINEFREIIYKCITQEIEVKQTNVKYSNYN